MAVGVELQCLETSTRTYSFGLLNTLENVHLSTYTLPSSCVFYKKWGKLGWDGKQLCNHKKYMWGTITSSESAEKSTLVLTSRWR